MDPISIAIGLAQFAPSILRFFGVGESSVNVAEKVVAGAMAITGTATPSEALLAMQEDKKMQQAFNLQMLMANAEMEKLYLVDTQSARARDVEIVKAGGKNYRADSMYILAICLVASLVYIVLKSGLDEYAKGIITLVLGRFLGYLDSIYNFEFGTTRSSKLKDDTIKSLTK